MRKELPQQLLRELLKNSKRSDRQLAKILKVSQPTITRARHGLEKSGIIRDYTVIPNFRDMGFEILAITLVKLDPRFITPENIKEAAKYAAKFPNAILSSMGEGLGMNGVVISIHKNYTEYHRHLNLLRTDWNKMLSAIQSFIIPLGKGEFKKFSLSYLANVPLQ